LPDDEAIKLLQTPCANGAPGYVDAWSLAHPNTSHAHTVDLHDATKAPRCFDYVFVSNNLRGAVRALTVNAETAASDHQPLLLEVEL
jgi:endonuclease/exonuclease/phosphatase family metal-dependent hydrolase